MLLCLGYHGFIGLLKCSCPFLCMEYCFFDPFRKKKSIVQLKFRNQRASIIFWINYIFIFFKMFDSYNLVVMTLKFLPFWLITRSFLGFYNIRKESAKTNWVRQLSQKYLAKTTSKVLHCLTLQYWLWSVNLKKYLLLTIPDRCFTKDMWRCVEGEINILQ